MQRQSELIARLYARLAQYRESGEGPINPLKVAHELASEMPETGMAEAELAETVAKHAANLGIPVELDSLTDA